MNFTDLLSKMKTLDEDGEMQPQVTAPELPPEAPQGSDTYLVGEKEMEESSEVQINMSMQDLLALMGKMEKGHSHGDEVVVGMEEAGEDGGFADTTTEPNTTTANMAAVTPTGNDIHSKGAEAEKVNGGGNPFNVDESLVARLSQHYESIKEGKKDDFDPLKHVKNPTKGEKEAAKDVKRGSYKDRAAMLKSAEADGRLKD